MIKEFIKQWQENKGELENYLRTTPQAEYDSYKALLKKTVELVIKSDLNYNRITEIDDGDCQGTYIFLIPNDTYQPCSCEYIITFVWYGSCIGCDTLLGISDYDSGIPTEKQVKGYMLLCLHMVERMKYAYTEEEYDDIREREWAKAIESEDE